MSTGTSSHAGDHGTAGPSSRDNRAPFPTEPHLKTRLRKLLRTFLTGLVAVLPLALTVAVVLWIVQLLLAWIGPQSLLGGMLVAIGVGVTGSEVIAYLLGVLVVAAAVFGLGVLVESGLQKGARRAVESVLLRIPVIRTLYDFTRRFVDLLTKRDTDDGLKSMSPVWCHFGGRGGVAVLGLLSTPEPLQLGDRAYHAVLVPTAPVPIGGGLLYVPADWVEPATGIGVEALTGIYVSMGVTSPQYLRPATPQRPDPG
ncbi:DUF502 domain-containing protein [Caldimonas thermodepolymerans]|jgi:uncharacterized membrane protein|uniref:Membrane protein n=1 Tax=Caldimonas thermodepolymerans TaxID=215580 RepID=A0A2S5T360_9BURK|nr:hypothetical protein C1702_12030 [Caldimonas thermodepolymerans]QPC32773.1 DUF502 domain-containing protein [Caldimonas thermodepolymerans]RDI03538.1 putative membrane protein [Caldimonas thermodepolymerans]TCP09448.1 putative membrane protein [Caldimonas thermodepolymerans]